MKEECWKSWYWDNYAQMKLITTNGKDITTMETASINQCPAPPTVQTQPRTALPSSAWDVMSRSKVFKLSVSAAVLAGPSCGGAVMFGRTQILSGKSPMSILKLHGLCKNASLRCDKNQCPELCIYVIICIHIKVSCLSCWPFLVLKQATCNRVALNQSRPDGWNNSPCSEVPWGNGAARWGQVATWGTKMSTNGSSEAWRTRVETRVFTWFNMFWPPTHSGFHGVPWGSCRSLELSLQPIQEYSMGDKPNQFHGDHHH